MYIEGRPKLATAISSWLVTWKLFAQLVCHNGHDVYIPKNNRAFQLHVFLRLLLRPIRLHAPWSTWPKGYYDDRDAALHLSVHSQCFWLDHSTEERRNVLLGSFTPENYVELHSHVWANSKRAQAVLCHIHQHNRHIFSLVPWILLHASGTQRCPVRSTFIFHRYLFDHHLPLDYSRVATMASSKRQGSEGYQSHELHSMVQSLWQEDSIKRQVWSPWGGSDLKLGSR